MRVTSAAALLLNYFTTLSSPSLVLSPRLSSSPFFSVLLSPRLSSPFGSILFPFSFLCSPHISSTFFASFLLFPHLNSASFLSLSCFLLACFFSPALSYALSPLLYLFSSLPFSLLLSPRLDSSLLLSYLSCPPTLFLIQWLFTSSLLGDISSCLVLSLPFPAFPSPRPHPLFTHPSPMRPSYNPLATNLPSFDDPPPTPSRSTSYPHSYPHPTPIRIPNHIPTLTLSPPHPLPHSPPIPAPPQCLVHLN